MLSGIYEELRGGKGLPWESPRYNPGRTPATECCGKSRRGGKYVHPFRGWSMTHRILNAILFTIPLIACVDKAPAPDITAPTTVRALQMASGPTVAFVRNVTNDTTAQNETPLAFNPRNPDNLVTGNNDWNYNDGCGVNASFDGGRTWTPTLPSGFLPGITRFTNEVDGVGTGEGDFGGD